MFQFIQIVRSLFGFAQKEQKPNDTIFDPILNRVFAKLRAIDPETHKGWLRLHRAMAHSETEASTSRPRVIPRLAIAVAVVAVAILSVYVYFASTQLIADKFSTGRGEQKEVVLKDGSQVTLNYGTELVVPKLRPGSPRRLSLTGEAYFRVQPGETPFIVSTNYADVQVVGTEFNLRAREGALEVAVIHGIVKVSVTKDGKDSSLFLSQRQMVLFPQKGFPQRIDDIPSPEYPGWTHGKLFFHRTSFLEACREIELRFDVTITTAEEYVHDKIITGILDARTAQSALSALCELTGKRFTHVGQAYTIY